MAKIAASVFGGGQTNTPPVQSASAVAAIFGGKVPQIAPELMKQLVEARG